MSPTHEPPLLSSLLAALLLVFPAPLRSAEGTPDSPDPARVAEIARWLPAEPRGVGRPITDREAWEALAREEPEFSRIVERANAAKDEPLPPLTDDVFLDYSRTGNRTRGQKVIGDRHSRFALLTLAECVEDRGRFLPAVEAAIREVCAEKTWILPAHDGALENYRGATIEIDLGSAATSWNLATAAWLLGARLSEETRDLISRELERRTFQPYESRLSTGKPRLWWVTGTNNWNAVCHAGVVGAAIASIGPLERRAFFVAAAEKNLSHFLAGFTPDGYCSEGLGYWNYGFGHHVLLAATILQATGGKLDLLSDPAVGAIARFASRMEILPRIYPAFADCSLDSRPDPRLMAYLAGRFSIDPGGAPPGVLRQPTLSLFSLGALGFPGASPVPPASRGPEDASRKDAGALQGLRDWFPDAGILICRPGRGSDRDGGGALGVALKGGHNEEHHNHNDVGSFVVALEGGTPLLDPGSEVYTARTFSSRRYESNLLNSFGHPVPRVAGQLQRAGRQARARIVTTEFTAEADTLVLDIRSAYDVAELRRLERTFVYSRKGGGSLLVTDEVEFAEPRDFETALITLEPWQERGDANGGTTRRLRIGEGKGAVDVVIETDPAGFSVTADEIREDAHGRKPKRLGIRLAAPVGKAKVVVRIVPARS